MYREILQILRCPKCNEELALITEKEEDSEIIAGKLKCKNNHCWQISEGVINFQSVEQEQFNIRSMRPFFSTERITFDVLEWVSPNCLAISPEESLGS